MYVYIFLWQEFASEIAKFYSVFNPIKVDSAQEIAEYFFNR